MIINKVMLENYLRICEGSKKLSVHTIKAYRIDLTGYLDYFNEQDSSDKKLLTEYIEMLHRRYKPKSVKRKIASMHAFFKYLIFENIIEVNPLSRIVIKFKEPRILPKTISVSTINELYKEIVEEMKQSKSSYRKKLCIRNLAVLEFMIATGVRISELCNLKAENISLQDRRVLILGKGSKERIVQLAEGETLHILKRYYMEFKKSIDDTGYFFVV